jgi:2',3'-cyclic-nucleotide 2'-phosphodiesterase (5'-nucleotidase family)
VRVTILHTNDIHGRQERIAQIATLVREEKANADHTVLYLDAGDVEETTNRLSSLTKGTAMHRLLSHTTCDAATVGNACWLRYGATIVTEHARVSSYPQLLANFDGVEGTVPTVLLGNVGVIGLTAPFQAMANDVEWGFGRLDALEVARAAARSLRAEGAELVIVLSHLGLDVPAEPWDDRRIVPELQDEIDILIGAHTHNLLPEGEWIGRVLVAQAGQFGEHIGRIEVDGDTRRAMVEPVPDDTVPYPGVADEAARIEHEIAELLEVRIGEIEVPLDARFIAEVLRERMRADVGLFSEGQTLAVLPPGPVTRGALWEASDSPANPGVVRMSGASLADLLARGSDPAFEMETPRQLRGRARGRLEVAGIVAAEVDADRSYAVASTDWELEPYGGYALEDWGLKVRYDFPIIVREVVEEHLRGTGR